MRIIATLVSIGILVAGGTCCMGAEEATAPSVRIARVEPTPLFPRQAEGQPLRQLARLHVENSGQPAAATARITVGARSAEAQNIGTLAKGKSKVDVLIPDIAAPTPVTIELLDTAGKVLCSKWQQWQPQKKWTLYCCSYSHQDLGFGDYPHRLRTSIRHENIRLPLQFSRETDAWPDDAKYRFNIETSEPITSFISFHGKGAARELAQRIKEGRIGLGGLHNTANTEELGHELMARLFYMTGRHVVDLLGVPAGKTIQEDDVIGLTWPVAIYAKEAGFDYCFHGYNRLTMPNIHNGRMLCDFAPLDREDGRHVFAVGNEPNFFWQGPDGRRLLRRATTYERHGLFDNPYERNPSPVQRPERVEMLIRGHEKMNWPFSAMLSQDGGDFILVRRAIADRAKRWNDEYAWPHIRIATFDDYFRAIEKEMAEKKIPLNTVGADENNQWSDQDYAAARATGEARRLTESLPATETLATLSQALAGGNDQWMNLFQSYHRLLQYFEHTNAKDSARGNMVWYETELEENREMVAEAADYQRRTFAGVGGRLAAVIARNGEKNLIVFNPLPHTRTAVVRCEIPAATVVDPAGHAAPVQQLPDGSAVFVAADVPAIGYKTYALAGAPRPVESADEGKLESRFYRLSYNPATGALTSLFDKSLGVELVESNAPHGFNEYLYEFHGKGSKWSRMEKADSVSVCRGAVADVLTVTGKAEGVRALKQTVILYHDLPRVDFGIWMDKAPFKGKHNAQHEAVFVALPLAIPDFTIRHELPGCVIEPYKQQVEGSATCHYAIRSFTDLSNDKYGVTISPVEGSLVCYGAPTATPLSWALYHFKRDRTYPATSRLYLYLLNNMFTCNIAADQQGPVSFSWSLRSHPGDWKAGGAQQFGRGVQQPLMAWRADGKNSGPLPSSAGFMSVDAPNVMCSVVKPAEMNGRGFIVRLNETSGRETTAAVSLPMLPAIESVTETSLVENDRPRTIAVADNTFKVALPKFGVKTFRVTCPAAPMAIADAKAVAVADMRADLSWTSKGRDISHVNIYRDTDPACPATMLNFIGQSSGNDFIDKPRPNIGGWLRSCLAPKTTYYYRIVPVDRANNPGEPGTVVSVATPEKPNLPPVAVEGLRAILVSPITYDNFVNLLFRTSCEPDVAEYEIHRDGVLIGTVKSDGVPPRSGGYGEQKLKHVKEYDHATFTDTTVAPGKTYAYKVRAVDAAGQKGAFSDEVSIATKDFPYRAAAQSTYAYEYGPYGAVNGNPDPLRAWVSKPYGGGTKAKPLDVWWTIKFLKKPVTIEGVKIIGDHRQIIPLQKNLQIQVRDGKSWKTVGELKDAASKDATVIFAQPVATDALRVFVPAADLPQSLNADVDGIVRICELRFLMPDHSVGGIESIP